MDTVNTHTAIYFHLVPEFPGLMECKVCSLNADQFQHSSVPATVNQEFQHLHETMCWDCGCGVINMWMILSPISVSSSDSKGVVEILKQYLGEVRSRMRANKLKINPIWMFCCLDPVWLWEAVTHQIWMVLHSPHRFLFVACEFPGLLLDSFLTCWPEVSELIQQLCLSR